MKYQLLGGLLLYAAMVGMVKFADLDIQTVEPERKWLAWAVLSCIHGVCLVLFLAGLWLFGVGVRSVLLRNVLEWLEESDRRKRGEGNGRA
jgi:uncharacterized membrane protein YqjE